MSDTDNKPQVAPAPDIAAPPAPSPAPAVGTRAAPLPVDLGLQGGGSHGAFTWGVLDRLLEEERLEIDAISGASAGAMNAAALVAGYQEGGRAGAKAALERFWGTVGRAATLSPLRRGPLDILLGRWTLDSSPAFIIMDLMARVVSPYDFNLTGTNPLESVLAETIDFDRLAHAEQRLYVTATNVHTGRGRVFRNAEVTPHVLMASACLPTLFQAVEIDGEHYWDGGYAGNPTITPLVRDGGRADDLILIAINPVERPGTPRTAAEIQNRLNEISFNAATIKELRGIALLQQLLATLDVRPDQKRSEAERWASFRVHIVSSPMMIDLGHSSKLNAEWAFLTHLRDEGRRCAEAFLAEKGDAIGTRSTVDLAKLLEGV
ncbi:patatin-like phospholipase family protein [Roseomonas sp. NAR14]|uniref:Patatin-like phospholipase family protein n=1 Tax=Roseomonas acroporae TaxID=2937791 RepID=A0A9X2BV32_9PROT|nr:patatin-like phospholipase family protein [Roseomonas acroporae]MCK8786238.1 patatin-like phospholipase family protein [Roseomonas acroporae]